MFKRALHILLVVFASTVLLGQKPTRGRQIEIKNADRLSFDSEKHDAKILSGNVICEHEGALLYCDTAYIYTETNLMLARGNILITKGDSIRVTGDRLNYDGRTKLATLENNVKCVERDMTLTTNVLTFDVSRSVADYYNGGTIVDKENTLVSKNGHYYSATKEAAFHNDVVLTNPDYKMNSDTLRYNFNNKTSYFLGPSIIISQSDYIYCENGWYDTKREKAAFSKNALLVTAQQKLRGDSLVYDRIKKVGIAFRNVTLVDTSNRSLLFGDYIEYRQQKSEAIATKKAVYARLMDKDTLFIAADTLYHLDVDSVNKLVNAYHHVRMYKPDLQSVCDSASLNTKDSLIQLFYTPLIWSHYAQGSAKLIKVDIGKNTIKAFRLDGKAFLIQQVDSTKADKFNQLLGKTIDGFLRDDTLRKVVVSGNAEILYYPKSKKNPIGLNKTTCAEIVMWLKSGDVEKVTMKPLTLGNIDPMAQVDVENAKLKGFSWLYDKRPKSRSDLHPLPKKQKTNP